MLRFHEGDRYENGARVVAWIRLQEEQRIGTNARNGVHIRKASNRNS